MLTAKVVNNILKNIYCKDYYFKVIQKQFSDDYELYVFYKPKKQKFPIYVQIELDFSLLTEITLVSLVYNLIKKINTKDAITIKYHNKTMKRKSK